MRPCRCRLAVRRPAVSLSPAGTALMTSAILTLNAGSSSLKLALFNDGERRRLTGRVERLGEAGAELVLTEHEAPAGPRSFPLSGSSRRERVAALLDLLAAEAD